MSLPAVEIDSVHVSDRVLFTGSGIRAVLPDGKLSVVTAGGQQPGFLRVPGHTVDVLTVGFGHMG